MVYLFVIKICPSIQVQSVAICNSFLWITNSKSKLKMRGLMPCSTYNVQSQDVSWIVFFLFDIVIAWCCCYWALYVNKIIWGCHHEIASDLTQWQHNRKKTAKMCIIKRKIIVISCGNRVTSAWEWVLLLPPTPTPTSTRKLGQCQESDSHYRGFVCILWAPCRCEQTGVENGEFIGWRVEGKTQKNDDDVDDEDRPSLDGINKAISDRPQDKCHVICWKLTCPHINHFIILHIKANAPVINYPTHFRVVISFTVANTIATNYLYDMSADCSALTCHRQRTE